jgi:4,5:9,10-diseco-3-hydroxy-5,9,17-trioxoandrosta-1(10),2-diene-4-oate hydrolase
MVTDGLSSGPTGQFVEAKGIRVHCQEVGEGDPVIFLHGGGPGATGWGNFQRNMAVFGEDYRAITLDFPGFGKSDMKPEREIIPDFYVDTVVELLEKLGIAKASFVGNSLGGLVSLKIALDFPQLVDKLVLMGTGGGYPVFSPFPTMGLKLLFSFYEGSGPSIDLLRQFVQQFVYDPSSIPESFYEERLKAALDPRIVANPPLRMHGPPSATGDVWRDPRMTQLPHETLIIWGREDRVMPLDAAFILQKQIPLARLHILPKCGHWAMWERSDEFNELVGMFLRSAA